MEVRRVLTRDCRVNALDWIRFKFARFASPRALQPRFASPEFSKQERVSGLRAVSVVSAALASPGLSYLMSLAPRTRSCSFDYPEIPR